MQDIVAPKARKRPHTTIMHGNERMDNYAWLRKKENPEVLAYLEAENRYTDAMMAHTRALQVEIFEEMRSRMNEDETTVPIQIDNYWYYERFEKGKQYPIYCRRKDSLENPEETLLDVNTLAKDGRPVNIGCFEISPNHQWVAIAIDYSGSEGYGIYLLNLEDNLWDEWKIPRRSEPVGWTADCIAWTNDNRGFYYVELDSKFRPAIVRYHELDLPQDRKMYVEHDERFHLKIRKVRGGKYIFLKSQSLSASRVLYASAQGCSVFRTVSAFRFENEDGVDDELFSLASETECVYSKIPEQYILEKVHATSSDGFAVAISLVYREDIQKDGRNPIFLSVYGAYGGHGHYMEFDDNKMSLLDRGFILASAYIPSAKPLCKKNTLTDLIACAEWLIQEGYTSAKKIVLYGESAGGLLVAEALNARPDLWGAAILGEPCVDLVNSMLDPTIPFVVLEYDEWGDPRIKDHYEYMISYAPYEQIRAQEYPPILVLSGFNDSCVGYWEQAKWTAKLRDMKTDQNSLLLKTYMNGGHYRASGRYDALKEIALEYAFAISALQADY